LRFALKGKRAVYFFVGTFGLLFMSFVLFGVFTPKVLFFPDNEPKYINIFIEFPIGTDIEETNAFTTNLEFKLLDILEPYNEIVASVIAQVGVGSSDPNDPSAQGSGSTPQKARIQINFVETEFRGNLNTSEIMEEVRAKIGKYAGVSIIVDKNKDGPPAGKPINIEIKGKDYDQLIAISESLKRIVNNAEIDGIENLQSDLSTGKPELIVDLDRSKVNRLGLSTGQVASDLRTALFGKEVSKFKENEEDYPIMLRLDEKYRNNLDALMNKHIIYRDQTNGKIRKIPISAIATAKNTSSLGAVQRKDLDRVVTLFSNVLEGYNPTEINDQIKEVIETNYEVPNGYTVQFTGEQEKQAEEMAFLTTALMMAVFLIFLIIVAQFNRVSAPVIILFSVILSTIGVFLGLVFFQMDFIVIMTMIGIISLAGIVVNNAIVLIDYTDLVKQRLFAENSKTTFDMQDVREAIIISGKTRLRPVLLTAITTVLGLLPLAVGLNIDFFGLFANYQPNVWFGGDTVMFWGPMSWTIIFGITFATFLTLIIVPVMYLMVDKVKLIVGRKIIDIEE
jgi:multidrug efflux pump